MSLPSAALFSNAEVPLFCLVGFGAASFWRGAWYSMDAALFPDDVYRSCAASLTLGFGGFAALHHGLQRLPAGASKGTRAVSVYFACLANVSAWRGVWMGWDIATATATAQEGPLAPVSEAEEQASRRRLLYSGIASHVAATALLFGIGHLTSALAPPARAAILSDRTSWAYPRASRYLEDLGQFLNNAPKGK